MKITYNKELKGFLKDWGCFEAFRKNTEADGWKISVDILSIPEAFIWSGTAEGHDFWETMHEMYNTL